jgi:hypothetical protein
MSPSHFFHPWKYISHIEIESLSPVFHLWKSFFLEAMDELSTTMFFPHCIGGNEYGWGKYKSEWMILIEAHGSA